MIYFASNELMKTAKNNPTFKNTKIPVVGCSTSGEISNDGVDDESIVATYCKFEQNTRVKSAHADMPSLDHSRKAGQNIGDQLTGDNLKLILVLGVGVDINGK